MSDLYKEYELLIESNNRDDKDMEYGIPSEKKYPLYNKSHVLAAIKFFNYVDEKYEKQLASAIIKKMKLFNLTDENIGEKNRLKKYTKIVNFNESVIDYIASKYNETDDYLKLSTSEKEAYLYFLRDFKEDILTEPEDGSLILLESNNILNKEIE